jgi:glyoxylase-like metal-dependent hydrolase (beta-lactamase superfamily II)
MLREGEMASLQVGAPIQLTRRQLMLASAALAGSAALPRWVLAQAAPHSFKQGDFEIIVVSDGHLVLPANILAPEAPPEELQALLKAAGMAGEEVKPAMNAVLIRGGSDVILFDTGSGGEFQPETSGKLVESLAAAGVDPSAVTKIVLTHAHPDHIWGTAVEGGLRYPNAAYYISAAEWDFWTDPDLKTRMPQEMHGFVDGAQKHLGAVKEKVTMVKAGDEIVTGVSVVDTAGHTPGHISIEVAGGEGLIITADSIANPYVFFPHPDWKFGFDSDGDLAVANRKPLLDRAATEKMKMLGFHWPYPGVGFAERKDNAYTYVPAG